MKKEEQYVKLPYSLMSAKGYVNQVTGEIIKMSQGAKFIYIYLRARNQFFVVERGGQHYEAQATIAEAVGMDLRRTGEIILEFIKNGVILADKEPCSNGLRWHYLRVNNLLLSKTKVKTPSKNQNKAVNEEEYELHPVDEVPEWLWNDDLHVQEQIY